MSTIAAILVLALQNPPAPPPAPDPKAQEEKELTPEEAIQILKECGKLMEEAEALLNDSSRGKALGSEKETLERIQKLLGGPPPKSAEEEQKAILEKIEKLMGKSQKSQGDTVDKLADVIKRAKSQQGQGQGQPQPGQPQQQPGDQMQQAQKPNQPSSPATSPYDPGRNGDPINKFRSRGDRTGRWGDLPPRTREAMPSGKRDLDDFPPEFQQLLKEYFKSLSDGDK